MKAVSSWVKQIGLLIIIIFVIAKLQELRISASSKMSTHMQGRIQEFLKRGLHIFVIFNAIGEEAKYR